MKSLVKFIIYSLLAIFWVVVFMLSWQRQPQQPQQVRTATLVEQDEEFVRLVHSVLPAVVSIEAQRGGSQGGRGAGVIVSEDGYVVTNYHVVARATNVFVHLNNAQVVEAQHVGSDSDSDITILKIPLKGLSAIEFADSDRVRVAQRVFAVGNPLGLQETVTQGIISAKERRTLSEAANEFFQTDAAINPGNSGGPLVDMHGRLVGITSLMRVDGQGIAFAIPSNTVMRVFQSIRDYGRFIRPWFGIVQHGRQLTPDIAQQLGLPDTHGALIMEVVPDSPAQQAGLQPGDVVVSFNGKAIVDWVSLRNRIVETPIGDKVTLAVIRNGKKLTLEATIGTQPQR